MSFPSFLRFFLTFNLLGEIYDVNTVFEHDMALAFMTSAAVLAAALGPKLAEEGSPSIKFVLFRRPFEECKTIRG